MGRTGRTDVRHETDVHKSHGRIGRIDMDEKDIQALMPDKSVSIVIGTAKKTMVSSAIADKVSSIKKSIMGKGVYLFANEVDFWTECDKQGIKDMDGLMKKIKAKK